MKDINKVYVGSVVTLHRYQGNFTVTDISNDVYTLESFSTVLELETKRLKLLIQNIIK